MQQVSSNSFGIPNQQLLYSFPPQYFNPKPDISLVNFPGIPHFQNQTFNVQSSFTSLPSLPSSQPFYIKQEDQINQSRFPFPASESPYFNPINLKNEQDFQTKHESYSMNTSDSSPEQQSFPIKIEVKNEENRPLSHLHHLSKKIMKKPITPHLNTYKPCPYQAQKKIRRTWSPEEDAQVLELVKKYGKKWAKIATFMKSRNGKQVRDHYLNALVPDINRGIWTNIEDDAILFYYHKFGPQWCRIAECLVGRTETQVKGRFYTNLKQKLMKKGGDVKGIVKEEEELF